MKEEVKRIIEKDMDDSKYLNQLNEYITVCYPKELFDVRYLFNRCSEKRSI